MRFFGTNVVLNYTVRGIIKNHDFCQVIRNILYIDEEKRLIADFSHSELQAIGTTVIDDKGEKVTISIEVEIQQETTQKWILKRKSAMRCTLLKR
jgi:hypothetical protein